MSNKFEFKQFSVNHYKSTMRVGVDSILLGSWADISEATNILDVGTGCGLLALMCAQRNKKAFVRGIDIDENSIIEAKENFRTSKWGRRLNAELCDFNSLNQIMFDHIISNPPYFGAGLRCKNNSRELARHQHSITPLIILEKGISILKENGRISLVIPIEIENQLLDRAEQLGLFPERRLYIRGRKELPIKRTLLEFKKETMSVNDSKSKNSYEISLRNEIVLENAIHSPTDEFRLLCKDFYINF